MGYSFSEISSKHKGFKAEDFVCEYLHDLGLVILDRNYIAYGIGEIDIIAQKNGVLYFFEVRSRYHELVYESFRGFLPEDTLSNFKKFKIRKTAFHYINRNQMFSYEWAIIFVSALVNQKGIIQIKFYKI